MNFFEFTNFTLNTSYKNTVLNKFTNINDLLNTLYYCFTNEFPCLLTDDSIQILNKQKLKNGLNIIYYDKYTFIEWKYLFFINDFMIKKYNTKSINFKLDNTFFNIFYIKYIDQNIINLDKNNNISLVGPKNSIFGIYNSFQDKIINCNKILYFSFSIGMFILYKVYDDDKYVIGKLFKNLKYKNQKLIIDNKEYDCPKTFIKFKNNIYGIKKRKLNFKIENELKKENKNTSYDNFCKKFHNDNIYLIDIKKKITPSILNSLFDYLILKYPKLKSENNYVLYEPNNILNIKTIFSLYYKTLNEKTYLVIQLNQCLCVYIRNLINDIDIFIYELSQKNTFEIHQKIIKTFSNDKYIHLVSELYYFMICMCMFIPRILHNIKYIPKNEYIQANYIFSEKEINILYSNKSDIFSDNEIYLKSIFLKTLSVFMENYYCIIQNNDNIDIIPVYNSMSNDTILNLFNRSKKATISKNFLLSFLSTMFINLDEHLEFPIIFFNIHHIDFSNRIIIDKVYGKSENQNIPIYINIVYGKDKLHVNLAYKKEYSKLKYYFNEIISELLK